MKTMQSLLRLIGIREYAQEAEFQNPCLTYVLPDVICTYCNATRDMDLLRDTDLVHRRWRCKSCEHSYDKGVIEAKLVETVLKRSLCYQLQDLICEKCKQVKQENMNDICPNCSGSYVCKLGPPSKFCQSLQVFRNIATFHEFKWLEEVTEQLSR